MAELQTTLMDCLSMMDDKKFKRSFQAYIGNQSAFVRFQKHAKLHFRKKHRRVQI